MAAFFRIVLGLAWSIWFGGVMALFLFAVSLFVQLGKDKAPMATQVMFPVFERYHLFLAAISLISCLAWWRLSSSRLARWIFAFLSVATLAALISAFVLTPRILELFRTSQVGTPEFWKVHGHSNLCYLTESVALLLAGVLYLAACPSRPGLSGNEPPADR